MEMNWLKVGIAAAVVVCLIIWILFLNIRNRPKKPTDTTVTATPPSPSTPKAKKGYGWLGGLIAIVIAIILTWGFSTSWGKSKQAVVPVTNSGTQVVQRAPQGEWYWVLPPGEYINGRNESAANERTVDLYPQRDGSILAELRYTEYGQPETQRIRIYKVSDKSWKGSADQDNPEEHAKLDLIESSPGVYSGEIKWSEKTKGKCYLNTRK